MFRRLCILVALTVLSGCAGFGNDISNFEQRSVVYGWLNIDEVDGNHLLSVTMKQYKPRTDKPFYHMGFEKLGGGYLFYHYGFSNGSYKADSVKAQSCILLLCGNTINQYDFGSQGTDGAVIIEKPGVYSIGGFKLVEEDTGFFEQGKFRVVPTNIVPSKTEILNVLVKNSPKDHPIVADRLRASF
jgi:hypothetical protein